MAKDPAFLFYTGDFSTGTQFFTDEQVGKYLRLLMAQHQHGHLSEKHMMHICKSYDSEIWAKFSQDQDGNFYHKRLEEEIIRRRNFSESRAKNKLGKTKNPKNTSKSYDNHMETETENKTINKTKGETEIFFETYKFNSPAFIESWEKWKRYKLEQHRFKYKGGQSEVAALIKLREIAQDEATALLIIDQSIENGWKGLFEVKKTQKSIPVPPRNTKFGTL